MKPNKRQTHFLGAKISFLQNNFFLQIEVKTLCVCVCVAAPPAGCVPGQGEHIHLGLFSDRQALYRTFEAEGLLE